MSDSAQQAKAQKKAYDEACKRVLSERGIMAHILKACTEEFKDCDLQDIAQRYIERSSPAADGSSQFATVLWTIKNARLLASCVGDAQRASRL